jgi:hypothetical protein
MRIVTCIRTADDLWRLLDDRRRQHPTFTDSTRFDPWSSHSALAALAALQVTSHRFVMGLPSAAGFRCSADEIFA